MTKFFGSFCTKNFFFCSKSSEKRFGTNFGGDPKLRGGGLYGGKVKIAKRFSKSNFFSTNRLKNVLNNFLAGAQI